MTEKDLKDEAARDARVAGAIERFYLREAKAEGSTFRDRRKARTLARKAGRRRKASERSG